MTDPVYNEIPQEAIDRPEIARSDFGQYVRDNFRAHQGRLQGVNTTLGDRATMGPVYSEIGGIKNNLGNRGSNDSAFNEINNLKNAKASIPSYPTISAANSARENVAGAIVYHTGLKRFIYHDGTRWDYPYDAPIGITARRTTSTGTIRGNDSIFPFNATPRAGVGVHHNNGVFTIETDGLYAVSAGLRLLSNPGGVYLHISDDTDVSSGMQGGISLPTGPLEPSMSLVTEFAAGSKLALWIWVGGIGSDISTARPAYLHLYRVD